MSRMHAGEPSELRELFLLVEDMDAVAALDREIMNQPRTVMTDR